MNIIGNYKQKDTMKVILYYSTRRQSQMIAVNKVSLSNRNFVGIKLRWDSSIHETESESWTVF